MTEEEWPYSAGRIASGNRPSSRVRVYDRPDVDGVFMTWAWLTTPSGRPQEMKLPTGTTRDEARVMARYAAAKREREIVTGRHDPGPEPAAPVTLGQLTDVYLASETARGWSEKHRKDVELSLDFWKAEVGPARNVLGLTPADVEQAAGAAGRRREVSARWVRKRIKHLRAAVRWGKRKAKMIGRDPLEGVDLPTYEPDTDDLIYTEEETRKLWAPHEGVDWRVTLLVNIAADTGRRLGSMLALTTDDIRTDGSRILLRFRKEHDKGGKAALIPVSAPTAELLASALEEDVVDEWGWLFPEGRLDHDDPRDKPWGESAAIHALHEAESLLGVESVDRRAYHGIKRRHVTVSWEVASGDAALVGDVTGNVSPEVLRRVYRKAKHDRLGRHVDQVRGAMAGDAEEGSREGPKGPGSTRGSTRGKEAG